MCSNVEQGAKFSGHHRGYLAQFIRLLAEKVGKKKWELADTCHLSSLGRLLSPGHPEMMVAAKRLGDFPQFSIGYLVGGAGFIPLPFSYSATWEGGHMSARARIL